MKIGFITGLGLLLAAINIPLSHAQSPSPERSQDKALQQRLNLEARRQQYILSYMRATWEKVDGAAMDIAAGGPLVIRIDRERGVHRYTASGWESLSGSLTRIAVGPKGQLWGITPENEIQLFDGQNWRAVPGSGVDISVDNKGRAFVIGTDHFLKRMIKGEWKKINAPQLLKITNGAAPGQIYAVTTDFKVVRYAGQSRWWTLTAPDAIDISFGYGALWIAGRDGKAYKILDGGDTIAKDVPNGALHIAVGPDGVWVVNRTSEIYHLPVK